MTGTTATSEMVGGIRKGTTMGPAAAKPVHTGSGTAKDAVASQASIVRMIAASSVTGNPTEAGNVRGPTIVGMRATAGIGTMAAN